MNRKRMATAGILVACALQVASATTVEEAREQALSSTNFWGVSLEEYRLRISEPVPFLATNGTQSARQALCDWYVSLAGLAVPTNSVAAYVSWLDEQVVSLSAYSRFLWDVQFTNAWTAAACRLGALRDGIPTKEDLRTGVSNKFFVNGLLVDDGRTREIREDFLREQDFIFARQSASDILVRPVVEMFGCKGIPSLPLDVRYAFASNYVSQAGLSSAEAAKISRAYADAVNK